MLTLQIKPAHPPPAMKSRVGARVARRFEDARRRRVPFRARNQFTQSGQDGRVTIPDMHALGWVTF